jgi:hypothetical protein
MACKREVGEARSADARGMSEAQSNRVGIEFQTNMDTDKHENSPTGNHVSHRDISKLKIMKIIRRLFLVALHNCTLR